MERSGLVLQYQPIQDHPDAAQVTVEGSIDPKTVNRFKDELQALAARGTKRFFLDCARLTYVNSSGLAYLLNLAGSVKEKGGSIALAAVDSKIMIIFNMMGITELFQFYPSFAAALRDLDEKLARELRDVGPALRLEEPPKPVAAATPRPSRATPVVKPAPRGERGTRAIRPVVLPPPPENPILRFFRWIFGIEETRSSVFPRMRRKSR